MNKIFVVNKPIFMSSNRFLTKIKKKYKTNKAGFSGTLDPFAYGCLIVAFGQYTKLFQFLKKAPKKYRTTIWLGAQSDSLDIENIHNIAKNTKKLNIKDIEYELLRLKGSMEYLPPKYSAKKINGERAYNLARSGIDFETKKIKSTIFNTNLINYNHPFITFDIEVSEGSYIRSIAQILLEKLNSNGTLSFLERLNEGKFIYNNEIKLNPLKYLDLKENIYKGSMQWMDLGKKLHIEYFENTKDDIYIIKFNSFFSIIEIKENKVKYILNKIQLSNCND